MQLVNIIGSTVESAAKGILARIGTYLGDLSSSLVSYDSNQVMQQYGLASRPHPADGDGCAEGVSIRAGNQNFIIASRDIRFQKAIGTLEEGDTVAYAGVDANAFCGLICKGTTGSLMLYAPADIDSEGTPAKAFMITLDPDQNAIVIAHKNGSSVMLTSDDVRLTSENGANVISVSNDGIFIAGNISLMGNTNVKGNINALGAISVAGVPLTVP